jgi:ADP-ribose pyrophosphatase YjhB (NUDIX family)
VITCKFEDGNENSLRHVVVDTLILKDNKILLVKRTGKLIEGGKWCLAGGFVERDETLKEAVEREVMEESGYKIKDIKLLTIIDNPNRPKENRQNIAFVFTCEALEKEGNSDWEVDDQKWFDLSDLPAKDEIAFDHYDNIKFYLDSKVL